MAEFLVIALNRRSLLSLQVSGRRAMRSGGDRGSRRSTALTSTRFPLIPMQSKHYLAVVGGVYILREKTNGDTCLPMMGYISTQKGSLWSAWRMIGFLKSVRILDLRLHYPLCHDDFSRGCL
jgi:hypothetical protein